jgi:hypothetical protein
MFYLADELFKQKNVTMKITIGKPILPSEIDKTKSQQKWAEWIQEKVYSLNH